MFIRKNDSMVVRKVEVEEEMEEIVRRDYERKSSCGVRKGKRKLKGVVLEDTRKRGMTVK